MATSSPASPASRTVRFQHPFWWLPLLGYIVMVLFGGYGLYSSLTGTLQIGQNIVTYILLGAFVLLGLYGITTVVQVVETRMDGLFIEYLTRKTKLIPWPDIQKAAVIHRRYSGWLLRVHHGTDETDFPIALTGPGKNECDALIAAIRAEANLDQHRTSLFGRDTYERSKPT